MTVGPSLSLISADPLPYADRLIFNRIQNPNKVIGDIVHDTGTLRLVNTGDAPLTIHALSLNSPAWKLLDAPVGSTTIDANGGELDVQVKFIATTMPAISYNQTNGRYSNAGGVHNGLLTVTSDDAARPSQSVQLAGYWQKDSENSAEPSLQTIVNLLAGYKTNIASGHPTLLPQGASTATYYGEEIVSTYWNAANPADPVSIQHLNTWHSQGASTQVSYFDKGNATSPTLLWTGLSLAAQQILPSAYGPNSTVIPASANFTPGGAFGFKVDGEFSDDTLNTSGGGAGHHFRFYPLRDRAGAIVANSYLMAQDYGSATANWDFQDGVFIVTNVRPQGKAAMPSNLTATTTPGLGVTLQWSNNIESDLVGYNVYRATTAGGSYSKLNSSVLATPSFVDSGSTSGAMNYYRVTAVNSYIVESLSAIASAVSPAWTTVKPLSPTGIGATAFSGKQINLNWNDVAAESGYKLERSPDGVNNWKQIGTTSANVTSYSDVAIAGDTKFYYRVRSYNRAGSSGTIGAASATTPAGMTAGWNCTDIGAVTAAGSSLASAGVYTIDGSGSGIDGTGDAFHFSYFGWNGNGQIVARVLGVNGAGNGAMAGVSFRESLDPSARGATMAINAAGVASFDSRTYYAGLSSHAPASSAVTTPHWVKLVRAGSTITGFTSSNGVNWTVAGSAPVAMNSSIFVGLAVSSHDAALASATFDNVNVGSVPPPGTPGNLVAAKGTSGQIALSWSDNATDATGFKVERSTDGVKFSQIALLGSNTTAYLDSGLASGKTHYYRVRATKAGIDSMYSLLSSAIA